MTDESASSYDAIPNFGLLYDSVPVYVAREDVPFYVQEAARAQGAVLELGCGTGRITLALARAGHPVVGVDNSEVMLARCREKVLAEDPLVRSRITLHHADARRLELGEKYALAIAPFRVLQHLTRVEDQLQFLDGVARHLVSGGRFVFDVFNPNFATLTAVDGQERDDTPEQQLPDGRTFRRSVRVAAVRWIDQVSEVELIYYVSAKAGAQAQRYLHAFD
ncbi:MAG: class I SAM-dependent methyltransferase, partial [Gemmatimonadaceae bacterium]